MSDVPRDAELEQDFVSILQSLTVWIGNERVHSYNAGVDVERARCLGIAMSLGHEGCAAAIEMGATVEDTMPLKTSKQT